METAEQLACQLAGHVDTVARRDLVALEYDAIVFLKRVRPSLRGWRSGRSAGHSVLRLGVGAAHRSPNAAVRRAANQSLANDRYSVTTEGCPQLQSSAIIQDRETARHKRRTQCAVRWSRSCPCPAFVGRTALPDPQASRLRCSSTTTWFHHIQLVTPVLPCSCRDRASPNPPGYSPASRGG